MFCANALFGVGYDPKEAKHIGTYEVENDPIDITINYGPFKHFILPPGGYAIYYKNGGFNSDEYPDRSIVGGSEGMQINWKSQNSQMWNSLPFPLIESKNCDTIGPEHVFTIEMLEKSQLRISPPTNMSGAVKLNVYFYASKIVENIGKHVKI